MDKFPSKKYSNSTIIDPIRHNLLIPFTISILGNISGKRIADVGCGPGMFFSKLQELIPKKIVGYDISEDTVNTLKIKYPLGDFQILDISKRSLPEKKFDLILCILTLHLVKDLNTAVSNLSIGLDKGGSIIFCIPHPCFHFDQVQILFNSGEKKLKKDFEYSYSKKNKLFNYFGNPKIEIPFYHRPISLYSKVIIESGLVITDFFEPNYISLSPWDKIPPFLFIKAKKFTK